MRTHITIFRDDDMNEAKDIDDAENDPRSLKDYRVMWDIAQEHSETMRKIRKVLDGLGLFSKPEKHQEATREIHEILEAAGF